MGKYLLKRRLKKGFCTQLQIDSIYQKPNILFSILSVSPDCNDYSKDIC